MPPVATNVKYLLHFGLRTTPFVEFLIVAPLPQFLPKLLTFSWYVPASTSVVAEYTFSFVVASSDNVISPTIPHSAPVGTYVI